MVNRLFRSVSNEHISERLLVLVTPKVICSEPVPLPCEVRWARPRLACHESKGRVLREGVLRKGCCKQAKTAACDEQTTLTPAGAFVAAGSEEVTGGIARRKWRPCSCRSITRFRANGDPEKARPVRPRSTGPTRMLLRQDDIKQTYMPMPPAGNDVEDYMIDGKPHSI